jgi:hypothetical protein
VFMHPFGARRGCLVWEVRFPRDLKVSAFEPHARTPLDPAHSQHVSRNHPYTSHANSPYALPTQVVCLRLCDSSDREMYRAHMYTLGIFSLDFESPLTSRTHTDVSVVKFLSLSPFQGNALMLACVYRLMPLAYELVGGWVGWHAKPKARIRPLTDQQHHALHPPTDVPCTSGHTLIHPFVWVLQISSLSWTWGGWREQYLPQLGPRLAALSTSFVKGARPPPSW